MVTLKPRLSLPIGLLLAGALLGWMAFRARTLGAEGGLALPLGLFALGMACGGVFGLARRGRSTIEIDATGIDLPVDAYVAAESGLPARVAAVSRVFGGARRLHIPRDDIALVSKHASLRGRLIQVARKSAEDVRIEARHYCGLDSFLAHCRDAGLPTGERTS